MEGKIKKKYYTTLPHITVISVAMITLTFNVGVQSSRASGSARCVSNTRSSNTPLPLLFNFLKFWSTHWKAIALRTLIFSYVLEKFFGFHKLKTAAPYLRDKILGSFSGLEKFSPRDHTLVCEIQFDLHSHLRF
jgi:hypothetical protein